MIFLQKRNINILNVLRFEWRFFINNSIVVFQALWDQARKLKKREIDELEREFGLSDIYYKEHPLNKNYRGVEESRDWMFTVKGYFPSFFAFWKKCEKELKRG